MMPWNYHMIFKIDGPIVLDLGHKSKNCSGHSLKIIVFYSSSTTNICITVLAALEFGGDIFTVYFLNSHLKLTYVYKFLKMRFLEICSGHSLKFKKMYLNSYICFIQRQNWNPEFGGAKIFYHIINNTLKSSGKYGIKYISFQFKISYMQRISMIFLNQP